MIATGTDIKPVEMVVFMRSVKSRSFFEQMKGRGVRIIRDDDLRGVTPERIPTTAIYRGVIPFIIIQVVVLLSMIFFAHPDTPSLPSLF